MSLSNGLGDEQSVEWIIVERREGWKQDGVRRADRKFLETICFHNGQELLQVDLDPSEADLDSDLPKTRCAHRNLIVSRCDEITSFR